MEGGLSQIQSHMLSVLDTKSHDNSNKNNYHVAQDSLKSMCFEI